MNTISKTILKYEWKTFVRNRYQVVMLLASFVFGLYAIYYGQSEIDAQRETIVTITDLEDVEFSSYRDSFKGALESSAQEQMHDIASRPEFAWFRHGYHAILPPHDYAALAIGQRDLFRYYYRLTGMSLHYQLFENELANPVNLLAGNFDLSFVLIYLFPLLIIVFCYSSFSAEKENGTLPLLQVQSVSIRKIILLRLLIYFTIITGLALLISFIGLFASGDLLDAENRIPAIIWILGVVTYCAFWFALLFLIISFRKSSAFNAMIAAGLWLLFLIVVPALLNIIVTTKYPLSSTTLAGLTRRTGLENENDENESREVIMEFLSHEPGLAASDSLIHHNMPAKAYAAFTALKDINSNQEVTRYNLEVEKRSRWTKGFHWLSPSVNLQHLFAQVAKTDLETFLQFQKALTHFHGDITDFYFEKLFWDRPIRLEDYSNLPSFKIPPKHSNLYGVGTSLAKSGVMALIAFLVGFIKMKNQ
ncbi:MAG: DUF3526 domain-containing protein [Maribacter sp.]